MRKIKTNIKYFDIKFDTQEKLTKCTMSVSADLVRVELIANSLTKPFVKKHLDELGISVEGTKLRFSVFAYSKCCEGDEYNEIKGRILAHDKAQLKAIIKIDKFCKWWYRNYFVKFGIEDYNTYMSKIALTHNRVYSCIVTE